MPADKAAERTTGAIHRGTVVMGDASSDAKGAVARADSGEHFDPAQHATRARRSDQHPHGRDGCVHDARGRRGKVAVCGRSVVHGQVALDVGV
jgi:hypothetical protein